jgi:hypothetical protein
MFSRRNLHFASEKGSETASCSPALVSSEQVEVDHDEEREASARQAAEADVEDYLDHVAARLLALPRARRVELRTELGQHLRALAAAHEELGASPDDAAHAAVRKFGDPARIARAFLQTWQRTPGHVTARHFYKHALAAFAGLMLFNLVSATYLINLPPEQQRQMLPLFWPAFMIAWVIIGGPLLAGWHLGRRAPERKAARAIAGALATLCVGLEGVALLLSPMAEFGPIWQLLRNNCIGLGVYSLVWIPLGSVSASVSSAVHRRHRVRAAR